LKLEHNVEQHVLGEFDDEEHEKRRKEKRGRRRRRRRRGRRRRLGTLGTFKANLPPSIADSTFSLLISFPQSSTSNTVIPRPFPLSNCET
jgi:hypothetical protein